MNDSSVTPGTTTNDETTANGRAGINRHRLHAQVPTDMSSAPAGPGTAGTAAAAPDDDGLTDMNGHRPGHPHYNRFNTQSVNESRRAARDAEAAAADARPAKVVDGTYAAAHGTGLSNAARKHLKTLTGLRLADLADAGHWNGQTPTEGDVRTWHKDRGKTWNPPAGNAIATRYEVRAAVHGLNPKQPVALSDIAATADTGAQWAQELVEAARAENAYLVATGARRYRDKLLCQTTARLLEQDVPVETLAALPWPTKAALGASARLVNAWDAQDRADAARGTKTAPSLDLDADVLTYGRLAEVTPVTPLIDGLLAAGELTEIIGEPGAGKTFVSLGMAASLAAGRDWCGHKVRRPVSVLYVLAEGASGAEVRIKAYCHQHGITADDLGERFRVYPRPVQVDDEDNMTDVGEYIARHGIELVVFDTRARCTVGLEENSATAQGGPIAKIEAIQRDTGVAVVVVHHTSKGGDDGRGSSAWLGAVWTSLRVAKAGKGKGLTVVEITCAKHKEWPDGCKHKFTVTAVTVPAEAMPGKDAANRRSLAVTQHDALAADLEAAKADTAHTAQIKAVFHSHGAVTGLTKPEALRLLKQEYGDDAQSVTSFYRNLNHLLRDDKKTSPALVALPGKTDRYRLKEDAAASTVGTDENRQAVTALKEALCGLMKAGEIKPKHTRPDVAKMLGGPDLTALAQAWGWFEDEGRPAEMPAQS